MFARENLESKHKNTGRTFLLLLPLGSGQEELVRSVCRSGTPDGPFMSHLWTRCGNIYMCTVLKQASSLLRPLLDVGIRHTMGFPRVPASAGSSRAPAALWHGRLCLNISGKRLGAPRAHWCPPTPCAGVESFCAASRVACYIAWGKLTSESNALQEMLVCLKLWR